MSQRIREAFDTYLRDVGLADADPVQRRELRRAFFKGAWIVLFGIDSPEGHDVEEEAERVFRLLKAMKAECVEFGLRVIDGMD